MKTRQCVVKLTEREWEKMCDQIDKRFNIVTVVWGDTDSHDQADSLRDIIKHKQVCIQNVKDCWIVATKKLPKRILQAVHKFMSTELNDDDGDDRVYVDESVLKTLKLN